EGHKPAPPTVYRALEFLQEQRLVHRIASRNAFMGCSHPAASHAGYFLLCQCCGNAEEIEDTAPLAKALNAAAKAAAFQVESQTLELAGTCRHCRHEGHAHE
ncbi:MAG: transcriptional repressor, partial [Moraxellaceae bacterium]|nr:transcriptional repressor [Moraxellaceae bacterium]